MADLGAWWWLNPWRAARRQARIADVLVQRSVGLEEHIDHLRAENAGLTDGIRRLSVPALGEPEGQMTLEFVMVGIPRSDGSKRLMASKDLVGTALSLVGADPRWKIGAVMGNMIVIDKPSYGEGLEQLMRIWANWAASQRGLPAGTGSAGTGGSGGGGGGGGAGWTPEHRREVIARRSLPARSERAAVDPPASGAGDDG